MITENTGKVECYMLATYIQGWTCTDIDHSAILAKRNKDQLTAL